MFLNLYQESTQLIRTILSCALIAVFYGPKLIIGGVVINLHDIYKPREGIVFAAAFLISSTMVLRLTQARIESLGYFTAICFVHGIANVIDKMALPVREKLCDFFSRRRNARFEEYELLDQEYISHQSLVSAITETTSVILSNATAYLLVYHYRKEEERSVLIREMLLRLSIAVCIEWIFNIIALKFQNNWSGISVLRLWKREWKFILIIHLIQIIYVVIYFGNYVNAMHLNDLIGNSTHYCVGFFNRF